MEWPGSSPSPPIAATPPQRGCKEELVSQSSSGTHVSNASGISLGEVIRHQSAMNREMEAWYQPYTEIDTSNLMAAQGRRLGQTVGASGLMEFPTTEGSVITPSNESRRQHALNLTHTPLLEVQDSRLSPSLPLLTTYSAQGRTFFNETLFQSSGTDFAPLRGIPDVSSATHEISRPSQTNEATRGPAQDNSSDVDCSSLSQHPFILSTVALSNVSPGSCLSQYPLSFSRHVPVEWRHDGGEQSPRFVGGEVVSEVRNFQVLGTQKLLSQPLAPALPPEMPQGTVSSHDPFLLDSTVPAPLLLEMLEEEVGLSKHGGFLSSSGSSSCKSVLGKDLEGSETNWRTENIALGEREPEALAILHQHDRKTIPELVSSQPFPDSEGKPFTEAGHLRPNTLRVTLAKKGHSTGGSRSIIGVLPSPLLDKQLDKQVSEAAIEGSKQDHASAVACSSRDTPAPFHVTSSTEVGDPGNKQGNAAALGIQTGANKKDLTLSGCSIEREHKYTGVSPSFIEGSFFGHLAHPINHSTPGIAPPRALAQKAPALAPPVQSVVQPLPSSSHMETSTISNVTFCFPSVEKPRGPSMDDNLLSYAEDPPTLHGERDAESENSENLQAPPPLKSRIQSLPSLNFMEKVGVWNTSHSAEKMSDALASQRSSRDSPRQKAYSAIADSLNHILLKQQSQMKRQEGPAASFGSSGGNLHTLGKKPPSTFPLTRSRSENSVIAIGQEASRTDAGKEVEQEEDFRAAGDENAVLGGPDTKPNDVEVEDLHLQRYTALLVSTVLSDEETVESVSGESDLKRFISSERVAELLQEEAASLSGVRERIKSCWDDSRGPPFAHLGSGQLSMDRFSDVSPDSLNQIHSSVASSCADVRLSPRQPPVLSGEWRTSLEEISASRSSVLKTPENKEINIEERIPVYLHNLGIDQSPSSILTPFLPRGPIREIEFSPSELRTMKASTDALRQHFQVLEGDSCSVTDVTQSTLDSSTLSVPVLAGSDASPDTSLPIDLLPRPSRDLLGQGTAECNPGDPRDPILHSPKSISNLPAAPQPAELSQGIPATPSSLVSAEDKATKCVQALVDRFNPKELGRGKLSSIFLSEEEGQMRAHKELHSSHTDSSQEEARDSFVESQTLKEIQELLAQAEARGPSRFIPISSRDQGSSLVRTKKTDDREDFRSAQENSPGRQRVWSWDETLTRQNVHKDTFLSKGLGFTGSLKWEATCSRDITSTKPVVPEETRPASQEEGQMKSPVVPEATKAASQEEGQRKSLVVPEQTRAAAQEEGQMKSLVVPKETRTAVQEEGRMKSPAVLEEPRAAAQEKRQMKPLVVSKETRATAQEEWQMKSPVVPEETRPAVQEEMQMKSLVVSEETRLAVQEEEQRKSPVVSEGTRPAVQEEGQRKSPVVSEGTKATSQEEGQRKSPVVSEEARAAAQEKGQRKSPVVPEDTRAATQEEMQMKSLAVSEETRAAAQEKGRMKSPAVLEESRAAVQEEGLMNPSERSEPEGCNSATGARNVPLKSLLLKNATGSDLSSPKELQTASTAEPTGIISDILEGLQQILDKAGESGSKGTGSIYGSENSSSMDSLGIRVKNVLRGEYPVIHAAHWTEGEDQRGHRQKQFYADPSLSFKRENASAQESENSSSVDSLAARVRNLLENEQPVMHVAQVLQRAEEDERKALTWVKPKLAVEPTTSAFDLNEEDRQKIEEMKAEILLSGKKAKIQDRPWGNSSEGISSPFQKPEIEAQLLTGIQAHNMPIAVFPVQVRPVCGADCTLPKDSERKALNSAQSYVCTQLQTRTGKPVDSSTSFQAYLGPDRGTCPVALQSASKVHAGEEGGISAEVKSPAEATKQITSITFASRKRSPPPPSASLAPSAGLIEAVPRDLFPSEAKSIRSEQLGPSRQLSDALNPSVSASSADTCLRDNVGFSPGEDGQPLFLNITGDKSQRRGPLMEEDSPAPGVEQKISSVTENREEAVRTSPVFTGLSGNDRPLGDPGRKMADCPLSLNLSQQTTENDSFQGGFSASFGSFAHDLSRLGDSDTGNSFLFPSFSPEHDSTVMPASPSSPTRKALSGVHITLSPKRLDFPNLPATEAEIRQSGVFKTGSHPVTSSAPHLLLETTSKPSEHYPQTQDSAYFPGETVSPDPDISRLPSSEVATAALRRSQELSENRPSCSVLDQKSSGVLGSGGRDQERNLKVTVSSQTEKLSSDAITQITTESPEKTTYSAEIFVSADDGESGAVRSSHRKSHEIPHTDPPALDQVSVWGRQIGKPHLLPYKPPGSSEMYYVPCPKETLRLSRVRSETTVESSHSGSNDAIPPEFPMQALGSREENPQNAVAIKHKEGIYSKKAVPKVAWAEEKAVPQDRVQESAQTRSSLESVQATHSVFRSAQFYLHHPMPLQHEIDFHDGNEVMERSVEAKHPMPPSRDFFQYKERPERGQRPFSLHQRAGEQKFSPLVPELDYSLLQEQMVTETCERDSPRKEAQPDAKKAGHQAAEELPLPDSQTGLSRERQVADLLHRRPVHFSDSLDELWSKYLERQQRRDPGSHKNEPSLVERLDRLARLLQNPVWHSLRPATDEESNVQGKGRRREPKKIRSHRETQGDKSHPVSQVEESHDTTDSSSFSKPRRHLTGDTGAAGLHHRTLEQNSEIPSDTSSETKPGEGLCTLTDISTSESDAATLEETAPSTEVGGSVSSIDTARLIRAFGHDRVHASPKLSQLYSTIGLQKSRSEKQAKGSRRALRADPQKMTREYKRKVTQAIYSVSSSDSVSTPGISRGPSSALSNKRTTRMLNKAVQAGDFEIVNSATKRNTRDVGLTFPTPVSSRTKLRGDGTEDELFQPDRLLSGNRDRQKRQLSGLLAEKRTMRNKLKGMKGVSWFVPAEDLKPDPKIETESGGIPGPALSWFEPVTGTKPWREPLREKNWPEDPRGLQVRLTAPARDVENKPPPPYAKLSLQEALVLRRPDFISRSGERVKRLKLIMEERKLQSILQSEREQLFNPPEKRRAYRNGHVTGRGYPALQRANSISKNEMVQRSKRIYEQLPEVRKRREEEKRKSEYSEYRLKAQLYKTKITNHILGRKVPWK